MAREDPSACAQCGSKKIEQDPDVLDTWFSSGLWPFATLGWPDDTPDLRAFYPTTLLVTGFDIIFFWAARMIMLGMEMMGDIPFRQVHIHGLVRDAERQKMSKTKGNVIDPLVINDKYGTDAVRFGLLVAAAPGNDIALSEEVLARGRNFANKIWNASRLLFSREHTGDGRPACDADRWILSRVNHCAKQANEAFAHHRYHEAADAVWAFFWDEFCDKYISNKRPDEDWSCAYRVYDSALRLIHPLMPFVTEELWHRLHSNDGSIALALYPQFDARLHDEAAERAFGPTGVISRTFDDIRAFRAMSGFDARAVFPVEGMYADDYRTVVSNNSTWIAAGTRTDFRVSHNPPPPGLIASFKFPSELSESHREKLRRENEQLEKVIANSKRQLDNEDIVRKMPEKVVATLRSKLAEYEAQLKKNRDALGE